MPNDFSLLESRWLGELADAALLSVFFGVLDYSAIDGHFLARGLRELFDAHALSDSNHELVRVLQDKLNGLSNEESLLLLDKEKGQYRIKWRHNEADAAPDRTTFGGLG